jgi:hypothetical protein
MVSVAAAFRLLLRQQLRKYFPFRIGVRLRQPFSEEGQVLLADEFLHTASADF